jgi:1,4-dihydroxy-2-naphthoate polyprenyltransferase
MKIWLNAFRLRTLPLAFSCIITGAGLSHEAGFFDLVIFVLAILTTLFLQILSNLANDFGDDEKGTDNENRIGPMRSLQSGAITKAQMKKAIIVFVFLSLFSGVSLVIYATRNLSILFPIGFISLGLLAIVAAIKYTSGNSAYGYKGLGDLFVFLFFGIVGVGGTYLLFSNQLESSILLLAISIGFFSSAVLNLNNMRDWENDKSCNKNTLVVRIGVSKAKKYHFLLLVLGMFSAVFYVLQDSFKPINLLFVLAFIPFIIHLKKVLTVENPRDFDPELKKVALTTFLFSILFWISIIQ